MTGLNWLYLSDCFGVQVALHQTAVSAPVAIMMGVVTGTAGGVIRDIICNEIPLILKREIYATASALGGLSTASLMHCNSP